MEVKEIIESLKYNNDGKLQKESILEARNHKEDVTENLLIELDKVANNIENYAKDQTYFLPLYAMFLLAEFREKRAFSIIIKLITSNQNAVDDLLGDLITGDLKKILASTFDGNVDCLYNIITNLELNEYVRGAAFHSLEILNKYNIIKNEEIIEMIDKMLLNELKEDYSVVISDIVVYISENQIYDKVELVRNLYNENRVNIQMIGDYDQFIDDIYGKIDYHSDKNMIEDTIKCLSWWACFNQEDNDKNIDFAQKMQEFIKDEMKREQQAITKTKEIGRNDLCYCGSGKKYKKCCMNKKEISITTPADLYIEKSLKNYPKEELMKFYDKESIKIDEKLYQVLKHKAIPLWVDRNYREEARRNTKNMKEALELIKEKCQKENINTIQEFDRKIAIHYTLNEIVNKYFDIIDTNRNEIFEKQQEQKVDFLFHIFQIIDVDKENKIQYIDKIIDSYLEDDYYIDDAEKIIYRFKEQCPDIKQYLNIELSKVYLQSGCRIEKTLEPIEECIQEFGINEELDIRKIEIYYEYILLDYYEEEKQEAEIYQKLWQLVKSFIKSKNITTEDKYDEKQEEEYYFSNILYRIEKFYYKNNKKYIKQREEFIKEALEIMKLGENSKEILISGLTENYCDMNKESEAVKLIDEFIKEFPDNENAIITKANIYSNKEKPEYEKAIGILEKALTNNPKYSKHLLYSKIALLYDEYGNEEKANEYQKLAIKYEDEELPF